MTNQCEKVGEQVETISVDEVAKVDGQEEQKCCFSLINKRSFTLPLSIDIDDLMVMFMIKRFCVDQNTVTKIVETNMYLLSEFVREYVSMCRRFYVEFKFDIFAYFDTVKDECMQQNENENEMFEFSLKTFNENIGYNKSKEIRRMILEKYVEIYNRTNSIDHMLTSIHAGYLLFLAIHHDINDIYVLQNMFTCLCANPRAILHPLGGVGEGYISKHDCYALCPKKRHSLLCDGMGHLSE